MTIVTQASTQKSSIHQQILAISLFAFFTHPMLINAMHIDTHQKATTSLKEKEQKTAENIIPYFLTHNVFSPHDVATAICSILHLQQTCKFWYHLLAHMDSKKIVEYCFYNGKQIDVNELLGASLEQQLSPISAKEFIPSSITTTPELYLFAKANVNDHNKYGKSFMGLAAALQTQKYFRMLIKKGGNIFIADIQESPLLFVGTLHTDGHNFKGLLGNEPLHYLQDKPEGGELHKGKTPLFYAIELNSEKNIKLINQITGVLRLPGIKQKYYLNTNIPNAHEALDYIDKHVNEYGMIKYESDDE